jgi:ABC-type phosphate transport system substrate-binding protein
MTRRVLALTAAVLAALAWPLHQTALTQTAQPAALAIIVHRSNPVDGLTLSEVRRIFMLDTQTWPHGRKITVVLREKGQPERADAIRLLCGMSEADFDRYVLFQTFRGALGQEPRAIRSASSMLRFVFNVPGAIGYVPADLADGSTKVLRIDGLLPDSPKYPLRRRTARSPDAGER